MLGYQPQSFDTNPKIDKFIMQAFRQMPAWKKAHLTNEATKGIQQWAIIGIRNQYPHANTDEIRFQLAGIASRLLGDAGVIQILLLPRA